MDTEAYDETELRLHNDWVRAELDYMTARSIYWKIQARDGNFRTPDAIRADKALDQAHANATTKRKILNQYRFR